MDHWNRFIQNFTHMFHQLIHRKIQLIDIIVSIVPPPILFSIRKPDKHHNIPHASHCLLIFPSPHYQKLSSGNLPQQIIYIPPIPFPEDLWSPTLRIVSKVPVAASTPQNSHRKYFKNPLKEKIIIK